MHQWSKWLFAVAAPLLFTACLWAPGKFASDLTLKKDGSFSLDYRGEILFELSDRQSEQWKPEMAVCHRTDGTDRPCSAAEVAQQKTQFDQNRKQDQEKMKALGLPGLDDESNRAFAAKLMKYAGWRSVTYRGKGVFDVDYHFEGRTTQDFLFPIMPDNNFVVPFIALRRRADGSVLVTAPGIAGGLNSLGPMASQMGGDNEAPPSHAQGRFTVHTDGQVLTNNSEDGEAADPIGRQVHWDIAPGSNKVPETLIRL